MNWKCKVATASDNAHDGFSGSIIELLNQSATYIWVLNVYTHGATFCSLEKIVDFIHYQKNGETTRA